MAEFFAVDINSGGALEFDSKFVGEFLNSWVNSIVCKDPTLRVHMFVRAKNQGSDSKSKNSDFESVEREAERYAEEFSKPPEEWSPLTKLLLNNCLLSYVEKLRNPYSLVINIYLSVIDYIRTSPIDDEKKEASYQLVRSSFPSQYYLFPLWFIAQHVTSSHFPLYERNHSKAFPDQKDWFISDLGSEDLKRLSPFVTEWFDFKNGVTGNATNCD